MGTRVRSSPCVPETGEEGEEKIKRLERDIVVPLSFSAFLSFLSPFWLTALEDNHAKRVNVRPAAVNNDFSVCLSLAVAAQNDVWAARAC